MISAKEARAKTDSDADQSLVSAVLSNLETKILWNAEAGKSTLDWDFGDSHKLGTAVRERLRGLGYTTEMFNRGRSLRISW